MNDTYTDTPVESDAIPFSTSELPLDNFINPYSIPNQPMPKSENYFLLPSLNEQPKWWSANYWLDRFFLYLIEKNLETDRVEKNRNKIRSLKNYFQNFNNENIPSIWQINSYGDQIRLMHRLIRDRIISKYENKKMVKSVSSVKNLWMNNLTRRTFNEILKQPSSGVVYDPIPDEISGIDPNFTEEDAQLLFNKSLERERSEFIKTEANKLVTKSKNVKHEGLPQ